MATLKSKVKTFLSGLQVPLFDARSSIKTDLSSLGDTVIDLDCIINA